MINPLHNDTNKIELWGKFLPSLQIRTMIEPNIKMFQDKNPDIDIISESE
jgi:hypothetical protein